MATRQCDINRGKNLHVHDRGKNLAALDGDNGDTLIALFTNGPGLAEPLAMRRGGQDYYYHADALGSVVALSNGNGDMVETYSYQAFGRPTIKDGSGNPISVSAVGNPLMFTGTEHDPETGFYHMGFRYLDPDTGRWTQEDPIGFLGGDVNLFAYAADNPIRFIDPTGLLSLVVGGNAGAIILPHARSGYLGLGLTIHFPSGELRGYTTTALGKGVNAAGWYAGWGAEMSLIRGDPCTVAGSFATYVVAIPGTLWSVSLHTNAAGPQGIGIGFGPSIGAGRFDTNTRLYPNENVHTSRRPADPYRGIPSTPYW